MGDAGTDGAVDGADAASSDGRGGGGGIGGQDQEEEETIPTDSKSCLVVATAHVRVGKEDD